MDALWWDAQKPFHICFFLAPSFVASRDATISLLQVPSLWSEQSDMKRENRVQSEERREEEKEKSRFFASIIRTKISPSRTGLKIQKKDDISLLEKSMPHGLPCGTLAGRGTLISTPWAQLKFFEQRDRHRKKKKEEKKNLFPLWRDKKKMKKKTFPFYSLSTPPPDQPCSEIHTSWLNVSSLTGVFSPSSSLNDMMKTKDHLPQNKWCWIILLRIPRFWPFIPLLPIPPSLDERLSAHERVKLDPVPDWPIPFLVEIANLQNG